MGYKPGNCQFFVLANRHSITLILLGTESTDEPFLCEISRNVATSTPISHAKIISCPFIFIYGVKLPLKSAKKQVRSKAESSSDQKIKRSEVK